MNDSQLLVVLATIGGTITVAVISTILTYRFTRRTRLEAEWRVDKLKHYRELLLVLPRLQRPQADEDFQEAVDMFIEISNGIYLVAPIPVLKALKFIVDELKVTPDKRKGGDVFDPLIRLIRHDLKVTSGFGARIKAWFDGRGFRFDLLHRIADQTQKPSE